MICIQEEKQCCGCGACKASCPVGCIEMKMGTLGALIPKVNISKCVDCGKCEKVCPMIHAEQLKKPSALQQEVYAAYARNPKIRFMGSSGGVFGVLANYLINQGYKIYGAGFSDNLKLVCTAAESEEELTPLMKSKYLQCDMSAQFEQIKTDLENNRLVMVALSPCMIAALKQYLGKAYENLLTVDFLCHGVPSQKFFDQCVAYEDQLHQCKTRGYSFRTKIPNGATPHYFTAEVEKNGEIKTVTAPYFKSAFYAFFQRYLTLRESCYDCVFSEKERCSDITIADFHRVGDYVENINRFDGVSTVIVNSEKGREIFESVKNHFWLREFPLQALIDDGVLFAEKTKRPKSRDDFVDSYNQLAFEEFVKCNTPSLKYFLYGLYYHLPRDVRNVLKKLCNLK